MVDVGVTNDRHAKDQPSQSLGTTNAPYRNPDPTYTPYSSSKQYYLDTHTLPDDETSIQESNMAYKQTLIHHP